MGLGAKRLQVSVFSLPPRVAFLWCLVPREQMQRAMSGIPPHLPSLPGSESLLGPMANITVLEKPWLTDRLLCGTVISGIPFPPGISVLHPLGSPFWHGHFLPRSYLSFQVLDTSGHSVSVLDHMGKDLNTTAPSPVSPLLASLS